MSATLLMLEVSIVEDSDSDYGYENGNVTRFGNAVARVLVTASKILTLEGSLQSLDWNQWRDWNGRLSVRGGANFCAYAFLTTYLVSSSLCMVGKDLSVSINMLLEGSSKNNPIYFSDSSPISVPTSSFKLLAEEEKKDQYRYEH